MFKYKIKEKNEDINQIVIEKGNITADFTIQDMKNEQMALLKYLKEFRSNKDLKQIIINNVEEHHPFVKDFTEEQLVALGIYITAKNEFKQYKDKIKEFEEQLKSSEEELAHIKKLFDLKENIVLDPEFLKTPKNVKDK